MINRESIPNRKTGEEIVFHLRRHWFIFFRLFLFYLFLAILPAIFYFMFREQWSTSIENEATFAFFLVLILVYYLAVLLFSLTSWMENYLDVWTVTTERIIDREQKSLFNREVSQLYLYRIQDVTAEQKGVFATLFHYGNVYIQSAATKERFIFNQVSNPYRIAKIIQQLDEKAKINHSRLRV